MSSVEAEQARDKQTAAWIVAHRLDLRKEPGAHLVQLVEDALREERKRQQWRPIATAPRDGIPVDLWNSITEERRADARFINGKWRVWGQDGFEQMGWVAAEHQDGFTHFMHIPGAPPSSEVTP